jgi:leucyl-tRNA synthetase
MMTSNSKVDNGRYPFPTIEQKWRAYWQTIDLYQTGDDPAKPDHYILDYFPYPSGDGLSVGHGRNYVPSCASARFMRMKGYNVLHPMGWDAFGLPAENYAIQHAIHPGESSARFSATYKRQMQLLECSYDWSRDDWLISRQRYWGAPIPIVHCPACGAGGRAGRRAAPAAARHRRFCAGGRRPFPPGPHHRWVQTTCPQCGGPAQRETDTMDGFACSSWYFPALRQSPLPGRAL